MKPIVRIRRIGMDERETVERLAQLYERDFSSMEEGIMNDDGTYATPYVDRYFTQDGKNAFLIHADDAIAGFALIDDTPRVFIGHSIHRVGEFFVRPAYRGRGIGKSAAFMLFDTYPGKWEVQETKRNVRAQKFWRRTIARYTQGRYAETLLDPNPENPHGPIQFFDSMGLRDSNVR